MTWEGHAEWIRADWFPEPSADGPAQRHREVTGQPHEGVRVDRVRRRSSLQRCFVDTAFTPIAACILATKAMK
jgi:hypothetical protein